MSNFIIQSALTFIIIAYNNSLKFYGATSIYGSDIPLAANGIVSKLNQIFMSVLMGIGIGIQPIVGFNIGAGLYKRVKQTFLYAIGIASSVAIFVMIVVELFPFIFINIFGGTDNKLYTEFAIFALRITFASAIFLSIQIVTTNFFRAMGKPWIATITALSKFTVFFLIPLYYFPKFWGLKGVLFSEPVSNFLGMVFAISLVYFQIKRLNYLIKRHKQ